ncbi:hypothetical protein WR25_01292 [Diploscapter pachys]|uniref:Uncharacterized protein n=1 Tax=Diploscapter pachys TaxID=2018661 RepID=A0A2A2J3K5_9BILA|nr:hypothetical protein WR25_01292 [Diploscapter pachys]
MLVLRGTAQQQQPAGGQSGSSGSSSNQPGYLPDYQGDKYTDPQRIKDTQQLNKQFFDTIGGAPPAPPQTPAQQGMGSSSSGSGAGYGSSMGQQQYNP